MVHFPQTNFFMENYYYHSHLSISPFHCAKFLKNSSSGSRVMRMCNFWTQNGPFPQIRIFSENLSMILVSLIHAYLHAKIKVRYKFICEILTIKEYWNLIGWEPFLAINWELDFFQACSFRRMLMNHMNAHFSQIPEKTNDVIFLESPKTLFWGQFWSFLPVGDFFQKIWLSHTTLYGPLTPCQVPEKTNEPIPRKLMNRQKDRRKDGQTQFHRTLAAKAGGSKICWKRCKIKNKVNMPEYIWMCLDKQDFEYAWVLNTSKFWK